MGVLVECPLPPTYAAAAAFSMCKPSESQYSLPSSVKKLETICLLCSLPVAERSTGRHCAVSRQSNRKRIKLRCQRAEQSNASASVRRFALSLLHTLTAGSFGWKVSCHLFRVSAAKQPKATEKAGNSPGAAAISQWISRSVGIRHRRRAGQGANTRFVGLWANGSIVSTTAYTAIVYINKQGNPPGRV